ncbi:MAG: type II toxin-antitoxin system RelE/ParE family toxin [Beijerinckiaceae bacterium]
MAFQIIRTAAFVRWLDGLRDDRAIAAIARRLLRITAGNLGDVKSVGFGVSEFRIDHGPGYRLYFTRKGEKLILLLCGGDKSSQAADIAKAQTMAREFHDGDR